MGGLSACAPIGSFAALIRYQGDVLTLVDCLYRDEWAALGLTEGLFFPNAERRPVVDPTIPLEDLNDFAGFCRQIEETIDDDPDRAEQLGRIMAASGQRVATDPSGETTVGAYDNLRRFYVDPEAGVLANIALTDISHMPAPEHRRYAVPTRKPRLRGLEPATDAAQNRLFALAARF